MEIPSFAATMGRDLTYTEPAKRSQETGKDFCKLGWAGG